MAVAGETPWGATIIREVFDVEGRLVEVETREPDGTVERTYAVPDTTPPPADATPPTG